MLEYASYVIFNSNIEKESALRLLYINTPLEKMPQRRDNAGAVCDSGVGMLFLTPFFRIFSGGGWQKIEFNFSPECGIVEKSSIFVVQKATALG